MSYETPCLTEESIYFSANSDRLMGLRELCETFSRVAIDISNDLYGQTPTDGKKGHFSYSAAPGSLGLTKPIVNRTNLWFPDGTTLPLERVTELAERHGLKISVASKPDPSIP